MNYRFLFKKFLRYKLGKSGRLYVVIAREIPSRSPDLPFGMEREQTAIRRSGRLESLPLLSWHPAYRGISDPLPLRHDAVVAVG